MQTQREGVKRVRGVQNVHPPGVSGESKTMEKEGFVDRGTKSVNGKEVREFKRVETGKRSCRKSGEKAKIDIGQHKKRADNSGKKKRRGS